MNYESYRYLKNKTGLEYRMKVSSFEKANPGLAFQYQERMQKELAKRAEIMSITDYNDRIREIAKNIEIFNTRPS